MQGAMDSRHIQYMNLGKTLQASCEYERHKHFEKMLREAAGTVKIKAARKVSTGPQIPACFEVRRILRLRQGTYGYEQPGIGTGAPVERTGE